MSDRLTEVLGSMGPDVDPGAIEDRLSAVHQASARRRRHRTVVRSAIGAAAAAFVVAASLSLIDRADDRSQQVVVDQPTETTAPTLPDSPTTEPAPPTPEPPVVRSLDDIDELGIVDIELTTFWGDPPPEDERSWNTMWRLPSELRTLAADALDGSDRGVEMPERGEFALARIVLGDGTSVFVRLDFESGWVEPDRTIGAELARALRVNFDEASSSPWEVVDLDDPTEYLVSIIEGAAPPWRNVETAREAIVGAFQEDRHADYERWYGEILGDDRSLLIRWRGLGDDSVRGIDYRLRLEPTPAGWTIGIPESRWLCGRGIPRAPDYFCI